MATEDLNGAEYKIPTTWPECRDPASCLGKNLLVKGNGHLKQNIYLGFIFQLDLNKKPTLSLLFIEESDIHA